MFVELLGLFLAFTHVVTIALIILWFVLRRPRNAGEFWVRFKREFLSLRPS